MPDKRTHRGPHPEDERLFGADFGPALRRAVGDLSWLLSRGYAAPSSLKLVGDRYRLERRQRVAVGRCTCSREAGQGRLERCCEPAELHGEELWIDGYNLLTTLEAALAGAVILHAQDGCFRDMASMHGSYRKVSETAPAIQLAGGWIARWSVGPCHWLLDRPVSNSGRLKSMLLESASEKGWPWRVELVPDPDPILSRTDHVVVTSDSVILDRCRKWVNLTRRIILERIPEANVLDLSVDAPEELGDQ